MTQPLPCTILIENLEDDLVFGSRRPALSRGRPSFLTTKLETVRNKLFADSAHFVRGEGGQFTATVGVSATSFTFVLVSLMGRRGFRLVGNGCFCNALVILNGSMARDCSLRA